MQTIPLHLTQIGGRVLANSLIKMTPRILVADDDLALHALLNVILSRAGFEVDFARDGREALGKIEADSYQAVLLDLILPGMSGIEILDHLKKKRPHSLHKIIVVTGASRGVIDQIDTSQIHALLRKPFDIQDVIRLTVECVQETSFAGPANAD